MLNASLLAGLSRGVTLIGRQTEVCWGIEWERKAASSQTTASTYWHVRLRRALSLFRFGKPDPRGLQGELPAGSPAAVRDEGHHGARSRSELRPSRKSSTASTNRLQAASSIMSDSASMPRRAI
jgi:hypothetical protein